MINHNFHPLQILSKNVQSSHCLVLFPENRTETIFLGTSPTPGLVAANFSSFSAFFSYMDSPYCCHFVMLHNPTDITVHFLTPHPAPECASSLSLLIKNSIHSRDQVSLLWSLFWSSQRELCPSSQLPRCLLVMGQLTLLLSLLTLCLFLSLDFESLEVMIKFFCFYFCSFNPFGMH